MKLTLDFRKLILELMVRDFITSGVFGLLSCCFANTFYSLLPQTELEFAVVSIGTHNIKLSLTERRSELSVRNVMGRGRRTMS